jgi:hypothetical protein
MMRLRGSTARAFGRLATAVAAWTLGMGGPLAARGADRAPQVTAPPVRPTPPLAQDITGPPRTVRSFYGWQILATGGVGGALAAASIALPDKPFDGFLPTAGFLLGIPLYALGGPVAHWSHGDFQKGMVSFGANLAFPIVGGLVGRALSCGRSQAPDDCGSHGFADGVAIGLLLAPVIDAAFLGWSDEPVDVAKRRETKKFSLGPLLQFPRGGMLAGVTGRF